MTSTRFLVAETDHGRLFAAIVPDAKFCGSSVDPMRLAASLNPFQNETEARAALEKAGGRDVREDRR